MGVLRLRCLNGSRRGSNLVFSGPRVRIGRSRDNDLVLPESESPLSSSHHAEAHLDSHGAWWIADAGSSHGTFLNGIPIQRHRLKTRDQLVLGDDRFAVTVGWDWRPWLPAVAIVTLAAILAAVIAVRWRNTTTFEAIAASAARSVYLIALVDGGRRSIVGTGFAVAADGVLATNAHVADALLRQGALGAQSPAAIAVQSDTYDVRSVVGASLHPSWRSGSLRDDAALLQLAPGPPLVPLRLADASTLAGLRRGVLLAAFGFPAMATDPDRPRGGLSVDVLGDIRGEYLQVGLAITPGTSGSPVFDQSGAVVAIVAGGNFLDEFGRQSPPVSAVNWALTASVVRELLANRR